MTHSPRRWLLALARLVALSAWMLAASMGGPAWAQDAPVDAKRLLPPHQQGRPFVIVGLDDNPVLADSLQQAAWEARARLLAAATVDWPGSALVVWVDNEADFKDRTGFRPHHVAAAANPRTQAIYINAAAWRRADPATQLTVLTHEFAHLLLGSLPGAAERPLPLWAEEGLAQALAGERTWQQGVALMRARAADAVPTLASLEKDFPRDPTNQELAYAVSARAIDLASHDQGDEPGAVGRIMRRLADPARGPAARAEFWSPAFRDSVQALVDEALGSRLRSWIVVGTSGTALWFGVMALALFAWRKKKRRAAAYGQRELDDEPWVASLTEQDVRDVWGEREDEAVEPDPEDEHPWERWERLHGQDRQ